MSRSAAVPSAADLAELIARGPAVHERRIWQPMEGDRPASVLVPLLASDGQLRVVLPGQFHVADPLLREGHGRAAGAGIEHRDLLV